MAKEQKKNLAVLKKSSIVKKKIPSDVLGSYTGKPIKGEQPVQDADDL